MKSYPVTSNNFTKPASVPTHLYACYKWLTLVGFTPEEIVVLEREWKEIPQLDGFDVEDGSCCFTFDIYKPKFNNSKEIKRCKNLNEIHANRRMRALAQVVKKFKYYMNPNKMYLKKADL
jgi:hypothetical protein